MLILTRRPGEIIRIGGDTKVTVMGVKGNQIRVGIEAPHNVAVDREEIFQRKQAEAVRPRPAEVCENDVGTLK